MTARPLATSTGIGLGMGGTAGYAAPVDPDTGDWQARLPSAEYNALLGGTIGFSGAAASRFAGDPQGTTDTVRNWLAENAPGPGQMNVFALAHRVAKDPLMGDPAKSDLPNMIKVAEMRRNLPDTEPNPGARENPAIFSATSGGGYEVSANHPQLPLSGLFYSPEGALRMEIPAGTVDKSKLMPGTVHKFGDVYNSDAFRIYPDLAQKNIYITSERNGRSDPKNIEHPTDPEGFELSVYNRNKPPNPDLVKAYMEKRLQYLIDQKEGLAAGAKKTPGLEASKVDALEKRLSAIRQDLGDELDQHNKAIDQLHAQQSRNPNDSSIASSIAALESARTAAASNLDAISAYHNHVRGYKDLVDEALASGGDPNLSDIVASYVNGLRNDYINRSKVVPPRLSRPLSPNEEQQAITDYLYKHSAGHILSELANRRSTWGGAGADYPLTATTKYPLAANPQKEATSPDIEKLKKSLVMPEMTGNLSKQDLIDFARRWRYQGNGRKY
jgi:hypothetical protein